MYLLNKRLLFTLLLLGIAVLHLHAQEVYSIRGIVFTKNSNNRIAGAQILNKHTGIISESDDNGLFNVKASKGDTVAISKDKFTTAIQIVASSANMVIFLQEITMLGTVTVKAQTKQQEMAEYMDDYRKKGVFNGGKTSALAAAAHPLNGLYDLFGSGPKNARRFAAMSKREVDAAADHRKYNKEVVKRITGLDDATAERFVSVYVPNHEDLQKWSDYEVIAYVKRSYDNYKQFGFPPELQPLITPGRDTLQQGKP